MPTYYERAYKNLMDKGFSEEEANEQIHRHAEKRSEELRSQGFSDEDVKYYLSNVGYSRFENTKPKTRWTKLLEREGGRDQAFKSLSDRFSQMLKSSSGRQEFRALAKANLKMPEADVEDFIGTLGQYTDDSTSGQYLRAGLEAVNDTLTGVESTVYDVLDLLPDSIKPDFLAEAIKGRQERLDENRQDLKFIEKYSEDRTKSMPFYEQMISPEALRNIMEIAPYILPSAAVSKASGKVYEAARAAGAGRKTAGAASLGTLAAGEGAIGYTLGRGEGTPQEASIDAAIGAGIGAGWGALGAAARKISGVSGAEDYLTKLSPEAFKDVEDVLKAAEKEGVQITGDMYQNESVAKTIRHAMLKNLDFRGTASKIASANSERAFKGLMQELDQISPTKFDPVSASKEIADTLKADEKAAHEAFGILKSGYGHKQLNFSSLSENVQKYLNESPTGSIENLGKIQQYMKEKQIKTFGEGLDFRSLLRKDKTNDPLLDSIPVSQRADFAKILDENVLQKSLPEEGLNLMKQARADWKGLKELEESKAYSHLQKYLSKDTDKARELLPRVGEANYEAKLEALKEFASKTKEMGRSQISKDLAVDHIKNTIARSLPEIKSLSQQNVSPIIEVSKALKSIDMQSMKILLDPEEFRSFKAYSSLVETVAEQAKGLKYHSSQLGSVFNVVTYGTSQAAAAPSSWFLSRFLAADQRSNLLKLTEAIKKRDPRKASELVDKVFPGASQAAASSDSIKGKKGLDSIELYPQASSAIKRAGAQITSYSTSPLKGVKPVVINGEKVADLSKLKSFNKEGSVAKALNNPSTLRFLKSQGYEAVVTREKDGKPARILGLDKSFNPNPEKVPPSLFGQDFQNQLKTGSVKDVPQDLAEGEVKNVTQSSASQPARTLTKEQKAHQRKLQRLKEKSAKLAEIDEASKTAKFLASRDKALQAQTNKVKEMKEEAERLGMLEEYQQVVMANENARIKLKEAQDLTESLANKETKRLERNAKSRQKTNYKNQVRDILESTNLDEAAQAYREYTAANSSKFKNIEDLYEGFKKEYGKPVPSDPFTIAKKAEVPKENKKVKADVVKVKEEVKKASEVKTKSPHRKKAVEAKVKKVEQIAEKASKEAPEEFAELVEEADKAAKAFDIDPPKIAKSERDMVEEFLAKKRASETYTFKHIETYKGFNEVYGSKSLHPDPELKLDMSKLANREKDDRYRYLRSMEDPRHKLLKVFAEEFPEWELPAIEKRIDNLIKRFTEKKNNKDYIGNLIDMERQDPNKKNWSRD